MDFLKSLIDQKNKESRVVLNDLNNQKDTVDTLIQLESNKNNL